MDTREKPELEEITSPDTNTTEAAQTAPSATDNETSQVEVTTENSATEAIPDNGISEETEGLQADAEAPITLDETSDETSSDESSSEEIADLPIDLDDAPNPIEETLDESAPEVATEEPAEKNDVAPIDYTELSQDELVDALAALLDQPVDTIRDKVAQIKVAFYTKLNAEVAAKREQFIANGNDEADFIAPEDTSEVRLKEILAQLKERRAQFNAEQDAIRTANLERKRQIIAQIKAIVDDRDSVNRQFQKVQQLQQEFRTIGEVPAAQATETWKSYQAVTESFYDVLKINKELRDYDFKKNLETKQQLCQQAEELGQLDDVVAAFKKLQELHNIWRETGPVAKEIREELWARFKDASAVVNKKYQAYFEGRKEKERENEAAKIALCERIEAIDFSNVKTYAGWDEATKQIIALQGEWKKLGFASKKVNADLFARFRHRCDEFFAAKANFFKAMKEELSTNMQRKIALCEKAEALKDSTDWKKTSDELIALQKEWKTIGPVAKKHSDAVWKRFLAACDYFFEQKNKQTSSVRQTEHTNLKAKKEIIAKINQLVESEADDAATQVRALMKSWQETGHVPFREKDKLYADYRAAVDQAFAKLDMKGASANLTNFEETISSASQDKIARERDKIARAYEQKKQELKTYENNLGFFNAQSKGGNAMLKEMERKIQKIKDELQLLEQKVRLADDRL